MPDPAAEGKRLAKLGDFEAALPHLEQAARENRKSPDDWLALGACYFRLDRNDDFREALRKALEIDPGHPPTRRFLRRVTGSDLIPARDTGREKVFMEEGGATATPDSQPDPEPELQERRKGPGCGIFFLIVVAGIVWGSF